MFIDEFKPTINHMNSRSSYFGFNRKSPNKGCAFSSFGDEFDYIKKVMRGDVEGLSGKNIWTITDVDDVDTGTVLAQTLLAHGYLADGIDDYGFEWHKDGVPLIGTDRQICSGFSLINQHGYIITEKPFLGYHASVIDDEVYALIHKNVAAQKPKG